MLDFIDILCQKRSPYLILFGRSNSSSIFWPERLLANMKMEEHQVPPDTSGLLEGMDTIDAPKWIYNSDNWDSYIYIYMYIYICIYSIYIYIYVYIYISGLVFGGDCWVQIL